MNISKLDTATLNKIKEDVHAEMNHMTYVEVYDAYVKSYMTTSKSFTKSKKPTLPKNPTPDDYRQYADDLEKHERIVEDNSVITAYKSERERVMYNLVIDRLFETEGSDIISENLHHKALGFATENNDGEHISVVASDFIEIINMMEQAVEEKR